MSIMRTMESQYKFIPATDPLNVGRYREYQDKINALEVCGAEYNHPLIENEKYESWRLTVEPRIEKRSFSLKFLIP